MITRLFAKFRCKIFKFERAKQLSLVLLAINQLLFLTVLKHLANNLILIKLSLKREKNFVKLHLEIKYYFKGKKITFHSRFFLQVFQKFCFRIYQDYVLFP